MTALCSRARWSSLEQKVVYSDALNNLWRTEKWLRGGSAYKLSTIHALSPASSQEFFKVLTNSLFCLWGGFVDCGRTILRFTKERKLMGLFLNYITSVWLIHWICVNTISYLVMVVKCIHQPPPLTYYNLNHSSTHLEWVHASVKAVSLESINWGFICDSAEKIPVLHQWRKSELLKLFSPVFLQLPI